MSIQPPTDEIQGKDGQRYMLRCATPDDLQALLVIANSAHHSPWSEGIFVSELGLDISEIWVVESNQPEEEELIGSLVFWRVHDELHIQDVAVHGDAQGRGLGFGLVEMLATLGDDTEMSLMTLEVRKGNVPAINLYEKCGFERVGERKGYYSDNGEDAIIMTRILA